MGKEITRESIEDALDELARKIAKQMERVQEWQADREAMRRTLKYFDGVSQLPPKPEEELGVTAEQIRGLEPEKAAIVIAEANDGELKSTPARCLMVEAGVIPDTRNASHRLWEVLDGSERFENVKRGVYRLMPPRDLRDPYEDDLPYDRYAEAQADDEIPF